jgi:hypothetical protein
VKAKKTPAPKRAGNAKTPTKSQLRHKLAAIRDRDPGAFAALVVLISRMVDK